MPENESDRVTHEAGPTLTVRAAVIALVCVVGISVAGSFSALLRYELIGSGHLPRCVLSIVMVLVLLNVVLRRLGQRFRFTRKEILFVYCTVSVMTGIPGEQFVNYFYVGLVGPIYHATPENGYAALFHGFIKDFLVPSKDPESPAIKWIMEGMPDGNGFWDIPWGAWLRPLAAWTPAVILVIFIGMGLCALLRKQWIEYERLPFPLARVPLAATGEDDQEGVPFYRNRLMWVFFLVPVVVHLINGLHAYFPWFPFIPLSHSTGRLFPDRPWDAFNYMDVTFYFDMIGIAFFLASDICFSLWFFYFFIRLQMVFASIAGGELDWGFAAHQSGSGLVLLAVVYLWAARRHLAEVVRGAFSRRRPMDSSSEALGCRTIFWGLATCFVLLLAWCHWAGMSWYVAVLLFGFYFLVLIVLTRIIAELGLPYWWNLLAPQDLIARGLGNRLLGDRNLTLVSFLGYSFHLHDTAGAVIPNAMYGLSIAGKARMNLRHVFLGMLIAVVVAVLACHVPCLYVLYTNGISSCGWWFQQEPRVACENIAGSLIWPQEMRGQDVGGLWSGAIFTCFLHVMRQRFVWWAFHPLGFVAAVGLGRHWFSILVGWSLKVLVVRLGGVRLWRKFCPAALGLILGNAAVLTFWSIVHFIWPTAAGLVMG
jgi:hypothetical protein